MATWIPFVLWAQVLDSRRPVALEMIGSQAQAMLGCMRSVKHLWTDSNPANNVKIYTYQHKIVYNHNFNILQKFIPALPLKTYIWF